MEGNSYELFDMRILFPARWFHCLINIVVHSTLLVSIPTQRMYLIRFSSLKLNNNATNWSCVTLYQQLQSPTKWWLQAYLYHVSKKKQSANITYINKSIYICDIGTIG